MSAVLVRDPYLKTRFQRFFGTEWEQRLDRGEQVSLHWVGGNV